MVLYVGCCTYALECGQAEVGFISSSSSRDRRSLLSLCLNTTTKQKLTSSRAGKNRLGRCGVICMQVSRYAKSKLLKIFWEKGRSLFELISVCSGHHYKVGQNVGGRWVTLRPLIQWFALLSHSCDVDRRDGRQYVVNDNLRRREKKGFSHQRGEKKQIKGPPLHQSVFQDVRGAALSCLARCNTAEEGIR